MQHYFLLEIVQIFKWSLFEKKQILGNHNVQSLANDF